MGGVLLSCSLYFQGEVLLSQFRPWYDGYGDTMFDLVLVLLLIMAGSMTLMLAIVRETNTTSLPLLTFYYVTKWR